MKIIIEKYMQLRHQYHALTVNDVLKIHKAAFLSRESHQCRLLSEDSNHACFNCEVIIPDLKEYLSNHFFTLEKVLDVLGSISFLADEKQMFRKILKNHERKPHKLKFMSVFFQYRIICELIREDRYDLNTPNATLINFRNKIRDTFKKWLLL